MDFYEYKVRSSQPGWKFQRVVDEDVLNIEFIHPLKQQLVADIVKAAKLDSGVKTIRVFGSAITNRCDFQSDLDLCVEWKFDCYDADGILIPKTINFMRNISMLSKGQCDVVHYQYLKGTVVEEAAKKGVIVYVSDAE
jgi:predicted nucleotidyltransferase